MNVLIILSIIFGILIYFISKDLKRVAQVLGGWGGYQLLNFSFDYLFWAYIQERYGFYGIIFLAFCALIINFLILIWYQRKEVDWLGVGILEEIKSNGHVWIEKVKQHNKWYIRIILYLPAYFFGLIIWLLNKNDILAFFVLSIYQDSFITTAFLRHGNFGKLTRRDYTILILSTIVNAAAWSFFIEIILNLLKLFFSLF